MGHLPIDHLGLSFVAEMFCCADHGTVTGFRDVDGRIEAEFESTWPNALCAWDFKDYRETVLRFAELCDVTEDDEPRLARDAIGRCLDAFWEQPSRPEAEAWSRFPWDSGVGDEAGTQRIAQPLTLGRILRQRFRKRPNVVDLIWWQGSLALSPPRVQLLYRAMRYANVHFPGLGRRLRRFRR